MAKQSESKLWAFLAVLLNAFMLPLGSIIVLLTRKDDRYAKHYAMQALVIWIAGLVVMAISMVPVLGWVIGPLLGLGLLVLWIITLVNSLSDETRETPIVGKYARKLGL